MRSGCEFVMSWIMYRFSKRRSNQGQYDCQWTDTIFQNTTCWLYPILRGDGDMLRCGSSGDWLLMDQSGLQHCHGIDYVTISLHNPTDALLPVVRVVQGDFHWRKNDGNFPGQEGPELIATEASLNLYLHQPITNGWCQSIVAHISYPIRTALQPPVVTV